MPGHIEQVQVVIVIVDRKGLLGVNPIQGTEGNLGESGAGEIDFSCEEHNNA